MTQDYSSNTYEKMNMRKQTNTDEEVKKTLDLLDHNTSVYTDPFFTARLNARLSESAGREKVISWGINPVLSFTLILLFTLNVITAIRYFSDDDSSGNAQEAVSSGVTDSYQLLNYSIYNIY